MKEPEILKLREAYEQGWTEGYEEMSECLLTHFESCEGFTMTIPEIIADIKAFKEKI